MTRDRITFRLNGVVREVCDVHPTTTLLQWLRRDQSLTGSKEGCGEGDCGACTVIVGRLTNGIVRFRAVNACILFVHMLEGVSLTTIEGIQAMSNGALNICQSLLVEMHGSQCGFCTPGFVMAMTADRMDPVSASADEVLAGNLCRCTGYGPIVTAFNRARDVPLTDCERSWRDAETAGVKALTHAEDVEISTSQGVAVSSGSLQSALAFVAASVPTTVVAGATDVGLWVTKQHRQLPRMLFIDRVPEIRCIASDRDVLRIGAGVCYTEATPALAEWVPELQSVLSRIGGVQVRNSGTIGGNIANGSPIGDMAPCLLALDAVVRLRAAQSQREMPVEAFYVAYGQRELRANELLVGIDVPRVAPNDFIRFYKVSKRIDSDITTVLGAFRIRIEDGVVADARVAFGGMAGIPIRVRRSEAVLIGSTFDRAAIQRAMSAIDDSLTPISDLRATAGYRNLVARNLLLRAFEELMAPAKPMHVSMVSTDEAV